MIYNNKPRIINKIMSGVKIRIYLTITEYFSVTAFISGKIINENSIYENTNIPVYRTEKIVLPEFFQSNKIRKQNTGIINNLKNLVKYNSLFVIGNLE
jgi:hypothetical protein